MKDLQRQDIYTLSQHSDLSEEEVHLALKENVYNNRSAWEKFLKLFFIALGIGFTLSGIIFFFAFNWADLNKFVKIGLIEALIMISTGLVLFLKVDMLIRNSLLTASAVLVGVLFAVFGQVYQTGADAYDFFLAWVLFITVWVFIADFAPLWLIYIVLINVTFGLYVNQIAQEWPEITVFNIFFLMNTAVVVSSILISKYQSGYKIPHWFLNVVTLFALFAGVTAVIFGIFDSYRNGFVLVFSILTILFALGIWYGITAKSGFFLATIFFSIILIVDAFILHYYQEESMFLIIGLFTIGSITGVVKYLISMQKKWNHEN